MKMVLAALVFALAVPAAAGTLRGESLAMFCQRCDPGPQEQPKDTPAGIVLCRDCSNQNPPWYTPPVSIHCATCLNAPGQPWACHGCDIGGAP